MYVIIDSSHQLTYTGILSGSHKNMEKLREEFLGVYRKNGMNPGKHWSGHSRKRKEKAKSALLELLKENPRIHLNIFQHRKPPKVNSKDWYLYNLPRKISQRLESWLESKEGSVELIVDNDYTVVRGGDGTNHFIENLLRQTSLRLTAKEATIRKEEKVKVTIKQANEKKLSFYASVAAKDSDWISVVDAYLGLYVSEKKNFENFENVYFENIG